MLAKKFRLPIQGWLREKGRKTIVRKSNFFITKTTINNLGFSRFGIVIGAKVNKSAAERNYLKRMIFNFIRLGELHLVPGKDTLMIITPAIKSLSATQIKKELSLILNRQINEQFIQ